MATSRWVFDLQQAMRPNYACQHMLAHCLEQVQHMHRLTSTPTNMQATMHEHYQIAFKAMRDASQQPWDTAVTTAAKFSVELRPWSLPNSERSAYISHMASISR